MKKRKILIFVFVLCFMFVSICSSLVGVGANSLINLGGFDCYENLEEIESYDEYDYVSFTDIYKNVVIDGNGVEYYKNYNFSFFEIFVNYTTFDFLNFYLSDVGSFNLLRFSSNLSFDYWSLVEGEHCGFFMSSSENSVFFNEVIGDDVGSLRYYFKGDIGFLKSVGDFSNFDYVPDLIDFNCVEIRFYYRNLDYGIADTLFSSVSKTISKIGDSLVNGAKEVFAPGGQLSTLSVIILSFVGVSIAFTLVGLILYLVKLKR